MKPIKIFDIFPDIYSKGVDAEMQDRTALSKELHDRTNGLNLLFIKYRGKTIWPSL